MLRHKLDHRWLTSTDWSPEFYGVFCWPSISQRNRLPYVQILCCKTKMWRLRYFRHLTESPQWPLDKPAHFQISLPKGEPQWFYMWVFFRCSWNYCMFGKILCGSRKKVLPLLTDKNTTSDLNLFWWRKLRLIKKGLKTTLAACNITELNKLPGIVGNQITRFSPRKTNLYNPTIDNYFSHFY